MVSATAKQTAQKTGWLGIDVGSRCIKITQVGQTLAGWKLSKTLVVNTEENSDAAAWRTPLRHALRAMNAPKGQKTACVMPSASADVRTIELPPASETEWREMIRGELEDDFPGETREFDLWRIPETEDASALVGVVSIASSEVREMTHVLRSSQLTCGAIDAAPTTLHRAVKLVFALDNVGEDECVLACDWGYSGMTVVVMTSTEPLFCRFIPGVGTESLADSVAKEMAVSRRQAETLIEHARIAAAAESAQSVQPHTLYEDVRRVVHGRTEQMLVEVERTVSFARARMRLPNPRAIILLGGGGSVAGVESAFQTRFSAPAHIWSLPTEVDHRQARFDPQPRRAILGSAAALSALAFQQSPQRK